MLFPNYGSKVVKLNKKMKMRSDGLFRAVGKAEKNQTIKLMQIEYISISNTF